MIQNIFFHFHRLLSISSHFSRLSTIDMILAILVSKLLLPNRFGMVLNNDTVLSETWQSSCYLTIVVESVRFVKCNDVTLSKKTLIDFISFMFISLFGRQ